MTHGSFTDGRGKGKNRYREMNLEAEFALMMQIRAN